MAPPHAPGVPGTNLPPAAREVDGREHRDSGEVRVDTLLDNLFEAGEEKRKAQEALAASKREVEALRAAAAGQLLSATRPHSERPRGPSISLGDAKWWVLVITALVGSGGLSALVVKWHELDRPTASQAQVVDVRQDVKDGSDAAKKRDETIAAIAKANDQRARIVAAFLCAQGLRAEDLDCDALLKLVPFQAQPLNPNKVHGAPQWHTSSKWPPLPEPPDK